MPDVTSHQLVVLAKLGRESRTFKDLRGRVAEAGVGWDAAALSRLLSNLCELGLVRFKSTLPAGRRRPIHEYSLTSRGRAALEKARAFFAAL